MGFGRCAAEQKQRAGTSIFSNRLTLQYRGAKRFTRHYSRCDRSGDRGASQHSRSLFEQEHSQHFSRPQYHESSRPCCKKRRGRQDRSHHIASYFGQAELRSIHTIRVQYLARSKPASRDNIVDTIEFRKDASGAFQFHARRGS